MATLSLPVDAGESPEILNGEKTKGSRLDHNTKTGHVKPNHEKFKEKKKEAESNKRTLTEVTVPESPQNSNLLGWSGSGHNKHLEPVPDHSEKVHKSQGKQRCNS